MERSALSAMIVMGALWATVACTDQAPGGDVGSESLALVSSNGITVTATRWVTARTVEADIATPLVDPVAVNGPHRIRVTLPDDYATNTRTSYPVVYLLHGGAGGNSAQWTEGGGAAEDI